jgi:hypothetical protein
LYLVAVPYYFTYIDDARSNTNQIYRVLTLAAELRRAINNGFVWYEANFLDVGENHFLASF